MSLVLTATEEPEHAPPRVRLEVEDSIATNAIRSLALYRNGAKLRFEPVLTGNAAIAYDYDAPFDQVLTYRADATETGATLDWAETWASLASWTVSTSGWSVAGGVATSSGQEASMYRDTSASVVRLEVVDPDNVTVRLVTTSGDDKAVISVITSPDGTTTLATDSATSTVEGTGSYTVTVAAFSVAVEGTGWSTQVPFSGIVVTRVEVLGPGIAAPVSTFGHLGTATGELRTPQGLAVDASGNVWVADTGNSRIQKFDSSGAYVTTFGTAGTGNGQFAAGDGPSDIVIDGSGNIWVTDTGNHRVQKFNSAGVYQSQFGSFGTGNGQFNRPGGIALDGSGNIWVTDQFNNRVQKFNSSGVYQAQFGTAGTGNGQFDWPYAIAIDTATGNMWVGDENDRVQKFNSAGVYQSQFGSFGTGNGQFAGVRGIALDGSGNIWVTDSQLDRVQVFDSSGVYQSQFGSTGTSIGLLDAPVGIRFDGTTLYVVELANYRVQKFTTAPGSLDDVTAYHFDADFTATDDATVTLSPSGAFAGPWLTNAAQPSLAILAEADTTGVEPDEYPLTYPSLYPGANSSDSYPFFIVPTTRQQSALAANTVELPIEGSADVVTAALGPRRRETWTLNIACTSQIAYKQLIALVADSAAVSLRFPGNDRWPGLDDGFYSVGDVETERIGHPQMGPAIIVSMPLTPARPPAYKPLWQWNWQTLAQTGMTWDDVLTTFPTWQDLLIGPV